MTAPGAFDRSVARRASASLKWNHFGPEVIPMWVADMDFPTCPPVIEALHERVDHGIFGYTLPPVSLVEATLEMLLQRYGWAVLPEWLVWVPGTVCGFNLACRAMTGPGCGVVVMPPVYPPFFDSPANAGCRRVDVPLQKQGLAWVPDADALAAVDPGCRMLLLCNPHNPVGRAFTRAELERLAEACRTADLLICSDEIHAGLVLDDVAHTPMATLDPEIARRTITLMSPSKTFNLAGLNCAFAVIPDGELRRRFIAAKAGLVPYVNALGYTACEAAYRHGEPWRQELLAYLRGNRDRVEAAIDRLPGLSVSHVEATYLAWIDAGELGVAHPHKRFLEAGVGLSDGRDFGAPEYVRLNFGCPRSQLDQALALMVRAVE